ncbi:hypothetical protein WA158_004936 [Blastocystis sp. Blastoise]
MFFFALIFILFFIETYASTLVKTELLGGITTGSYYTNFKLGSEENPTKMLIDTGSGTFILQSHTCSGCTPMSSNPYDKTQSTTASPIGCGSSECKSNTCSYDRCDGTCYASTRACCSKSDKSVCGFGVGYGDGTAGYGSMIRDNIMIQTTTGWSTPYPTAIGYLDRLSGTLGTVDGLLGLSYNTLGCTPSCFNTYFDDMIATISGMNDIFTMCYGNAKGAVTYGGIDDNLYTGNITWIDLVTDGYYSVQFNDLRVKDNSVFTSSGSLKAIFDSGTTLLALQSTVYNSLIKHFQANYCNLPGVCGSGEIFSNSCLTSSPSSEWPPIDIYLNGVYISLSPDLYFIPYTEYGKTYYCFGISSVPSNVGSLTIFGSTLMRGFTLIHDKEQDRIGIATPTSSCHVTVVGGINETSYKRWSILDYSFEIIVGCCAAIIIICCIVDIVKKRRSNRAPRFNNEKYSMKSNLIKQSHDTTNQELPTYQAPSYSSNSTTKTNLIPVATPIRSQPVKPNPIQYRSYGNPKE